jgi:hypothetical protein
MWVFFPLPDLWCILATCWILLYLLAALVIPVFVVVGFGARRVTFSLGLLIQVPCPLAECSAVEVLSPIRITQLDPKL